MTALVQASNSNNRPILLHYQTISGHSSGVSITQSIKDTADELGFLWNEVTGPEQK
jgi:prolyl oligopeptidase